MTAPYSTALVEIASGANVDWAAFAATPTVAAAAIADSKDVLI
jgi:hypothetical protein